MRKTIAKKDLDVQQDKQSEPKIRNRIFLGKLSLQDFFKQACKRELERLEK